MKRLCVVLSLLLALVGVPAVLHAQDAAGPASLAKYFPAETQFYAAIRTDDDFIDTVDQVIGGLRDKFPAVLNVPKLGLRDTLNMALSQGNLTMDDLRSWVGDYAAVGLLDLSGAAQQGGGMGSSNPGYIAVEVTDKAAAEAFMNKLPGFSENTVRTEDNGFSIFRGKDQPPESGFLALNDDVFILGIGTGDVPVGALDSSAKFTGTLEKLPADSYNAYVYFDIAPLLKTVAENRPQSQAMLEAAGIDAAALNPVALGFTLLDNKSLTIDLVEPTIPGLTPALKPVDPAFAFNIPDNFSFVIQATDLTSLINTALDAVEHASKDSNNPVNRAQLAGLFQMLIGLELDDDVLSWTTGDFALLGDFDMQPVLEQLKTNSMQTPTFDVRLGFVMDVNGEGGKAQKVVKTLGEKIVGQITKNQSEVKATMTQIGGFDALLLEGVKLSQGDPIKVDLVMAASNRLFVFADRTTAEMLLSGDFASLSDSAAYKEAASYALPGASVMLYADGAGWGDIVALGGTAFMAFRSDDKDGMAKFVDAIHFGYDLFSSSSISAAPLDSGDMLIRAVLTIK